MPKTIFKLLLVHAFCTNIEIVTRLIILHDKYKSQLLGRFLCLVSEFKIRTFDMA